MRLNRPWRQCLTRSPWPEQTPTQALRLLSRCPVLVIPRPEGDPSYVTAVYDLLTGEEHSGALELRICEFMKAAHWWVPICVLHFNHDCLAECLDAAAAEAERHGAPPGEAETVWRNELASLTLSILLYLGGEPDLVRIVHPGENPLKAKIARTDPERYRDLAEKQPRVKFLLPISVGGAAVVEEPEETEVALIR